MPEMPDAEAEQGFRNGSPALSARRPGCWSTPHAATKVPLLLNDPSGCLKHAVASAA